MIEEETKSNNKRSDNDNEVNNNDNNTITTTSLLLSSLSLSCDETSNRIRIIWNTLITSNDTTYCLKQLSKIHNSNNYNKSDVDKFNQILLKGIIIIIIIIIIIVIIIIVNI